MTRRTTRRRGAAAVEFALTVPVFLLIVSGIFDWSWFAYQRSIMKVSVTKGCRAASLIDPGVADRNRHEVARVGEERIAEYMTQLGGDPLCTHGCDIQVDLLGTPPGRLVKCSISGTFTPIWGMHVAEASVGATDFDRLAWQRWPDS